MQVISSRRTGKQQHAILSLPKNPSKHIYWVVYNQDMIEYTVNLIRELRGEEYMKHVTVVAKGDPSGERSNGWLYFDPTLMDLLGNGG